MFGHEFKSIIELMTYFDTEEKCITYLEELRWMNGVVSPYDPTSKVYKGKNHLYYCKNTNRSFNVRTGTLFGSSNVKLRKWFVAIWLVTSHKKGISSYQLARDLGVTQKTAWFMLQRIRNCYGMENEGELNGEVEVDETYVGGKNKNRHASKKVRNSQGRSVKDKAPVLGMVERNGKLVAKTVQDTSARVITPEIVKRVKDAILYTDEWLGYNTVDKMYEHFIVKHKNGEYVNGKAYTNTIEGFWSWLKRGIFGIYHFTSKKHLQRYVDEFVFRYNLREMSDGNRFNLFLCKSEYRITYKELVYGQAA